ncbi:phosphatase PAP2 family protein [Agrococcus beijingensis]|uniref:phosphatase PAP2 family protein n=1 Tax=Agrococcus beijingensis TaxID=3068634 RepID=UPI002740B896|nr:phosphatase PAP2 family protein [Agrococcus sp. REN33]
MTDQPTTERAALQRPTRRWITRPVLSAVIASSFAVALLLAIVYRESFKPFGFEAEWMDGLVALRSPFWDVPAFVFDLLGGGIIATFVLPVVVAGALLLWRRRWAAVYFLVASILTGIVVQLIKHAVGRERPLDILVAADFGSFPSGHSANAALLAVTMGLILRRWWVWLAGAAYTVAMMVSRTYLGAHWISDTIGGVLVAAGVSIALWELLYGRLEAERKAQHPPVWSTPVSPRG